VFVTVTFCAALVVPRFWALKVRLVGLILAVPVPGCCPVPVRVTVCVVPLVPPELSVMTRLAVSVPVVEGLKVTWIAQLEFGAIDRFAIQVVPVAIA
jgi:hypothetical protein